MKSERTFKKFLIILCLFFQVTQLIAQENCDDEPSEDTFQVFLPAINGGITEVGFPVPPIWNDESPMNETITIPNGRPIYALIVSGYASNKYLDEMMLYNFARDLMDKGAYVHYAWWNNLLAPYMERPLHNSQSEPGSLNASHLSKFSTVNQAAKKALPGEDYQFVADAKIFLKQIRENNPNAIIIVAGHSMGGGAVVHLGSETNELIDILAPIDPVGNRNLPFSGLGREATSDFNWTRWRVSRDHFRGYKKSENTGTVLNRNCTPTGSWLEKPPLIGSSDPLCAPIMFVDDAPTIRYGSNIVNLYHRYQQEALFPFDYSDAYHFGHNQPLGGSSVQQSVAMLDAFTGLRRNADPGGWPIDVTFSDACCPTGQGVGWNLDGHGEIIGYRGPGETVPLGVRLRTSPECGSDCTGLSWPSRTISSGTWLNGNGTLRKQKLIALENLPLNQLWNDRPYNPSLCRVSGGLIKLYQAINKPPTANAGDDQVVECTGQDGALVTLDGSASSDRDGDSLSYTWTGEFGTRTGETVSLTLSFGSHCIELKVTDLVGHIDIESVIVDVVDTTGPELTVSLDPNLLWPPNHKLVDINATLEAEDLCGTVESIILYSIVASEADNEIGSGNTSPDIAGAAFNTEDIFFKLRAERSGVNQKRVYTVTYKATDDSGNYTFTSAEVIVKNPSSISENSHISITKNQSETELWNGYIKNIPNPFSTTTNIKFYLSERDHIKITVYDFVGREVDILLNGLQKAGANSVIFDGSKLPSGIYIYKITSSNGSMTNKMMIRK